MSKIDYQVLREAAVAIETVATPQKLLAFRMKVTPQVVLALLDERDALNERLAELEADLAGLAEDHQKATESIKQADAAVKLAHEKFSALAAENAMLKQRTQQLIDIISNTDNDYCMCGSAMKDHVHSGCGYPTGMFDYYYNQWLESDNKTPATDAFLAEVRASAIPDEATERDLFEEWVMEKIFISKTTLEGLRTDDGYRNSTLSGTDYNGMWSQWKAIRALDVLRDEHEHAVVVEEIINDITARIASLRAYSGY
ncbi:ead/Ea22-like family protein [Escherichia coli]